MISGTSRQKKLLPASHYCGLHYLLPPMFFLKLATRRHADRTAMKLMLFVQTWRREDSCTGLLWRTGHKLGQRMSEVRLIKPGLLTRCPSA